MPATERLVVDLPAEMAAEVRNAVNAGGYSSQSEVLTEALRDWVDTRRFRVSDLEGLRRAWLKAVADDSDGVDAHEVFDRLEAKYEALAQAADKGCA